MNDIEASASKPAENAQRRGRPFAPGNTAARGHGRPPAPREAKLTRALYRGLGGREGVLKTAGVIRAKADGGSAQHAAIWARLVERLLPADPRQSATAELAGRGIGEALVRDPSLVQDIDAIMTKVFAADGKGPPPHPGP